MTYKDLSELRESVEENDGVLTVQAWEIRDAYGAERLGNVVRNNILKALASQGIGVVGDEIPDRAQVPVRLYKLGTPVADVIEAVFSGDRAGDDHLRKVVGGDAARVLNQIRELVCEAG